jgi:hypothetical protein
VATSSKTFWITPATYTMTGPAPWRRKKPSPMMVQAGEYCRIFSLTLLEYNPRKYISHILELNGVFKKMPDSDVTYFDTILDQAFKGQSDFGDNSIYTRAVCYAMLSTEYEDIRMDEKWIEDKMAHLVYNCYILFFKLIIYLLIACRLRVKMNNKMKMKLKI